MLTKEEVMEIDILSRRGMGIRAIARELGISRNTVRRYLRGEAVSEQRQRGPGRPRKLARYEDWLRQRVESAHPIRLPATVLHREIAAMGFDGTERTVRRFVAALYAAGEPAEEPVVRYETAPGHQAQMDWGEYRLAGQRVYAFVSVLGYSRFLYAEYVSSTRSEVLVACHRRMLSAFGGVPREILYDNMKTVVTRRNAYGRGKHAFHDGISELAKECGFRPRLCRPYRPQTKGKVERSVDYVARSFYHPYVTRCQLDGRVPGLDELNSAVYHWQAEVANRRVHGTTGAVPGERLQADRVAMDVYHGPQTPADSRAHWPQYPLQRSPKAYDTLLQESNG